MLSCSANLHSGLYIYILLVLIYVFLKTIIWSPIISGSTGPIFVIFAPNDRYLFVDDRFGPLFPIPQGTLPWQPILAK